jgi:hypothetical protein
MRSELVPVSTATRGLQALLTLVNATKESHAADAEVLFLAQLMPLGFAAFEVRPLERPDAGCPSASRSATVPCADVETGGRQLAKHGGTAANKASMGYRSLDLEPISEIAPPGALQVSSSSKTAPVLTNGLVELEFDPKTGLISFMHLKNGPSTPLSVFFVWYNASDGLNVGEHCDRGQASGAYIFRPNGEYAVEPTTGRVQLEVHNGDLVSEARQTFADWATLSIRCVTWMLCSYASRILHFCFPCSMRENALDQYQRSCLALTFALPRTRVMKQNHPAFFLCL